MMFRLPFLCTPSEWQQKKQGVIPTTCFPNLTTICFLILADSLKLYYPYEKKTKFMLLNLRRLLLLLVINIYVVCYFSIDKITIE